MDNVKQLQSLITNLCLTNAYPSIVSRRLPEIDLYEFVKQYPVNKASLSILNNELRFRYIKISDKEEEPILIYHIGAAMASNEQLLEEIAEYIDEILDTENALEILERYYKKDMIILETQSQVIHVLIADTEFTVSSIYQSYIFLRHIYDITNRILSYNAIIGAIMHIFLKGDKNDIKTINSLHTIMMNFEPESSPIYITVKRMNIAYSWYLDNLNRPCDDIIFYQKYLDILSKLPANKVTSYQTELEIENYTITSTKILDLVDTISNATTSSDLPLIIINTGKEKIFKSHNKTHKELEWLFDVKPHIMRVIIKISHFPKKYLTIEYNRNKNIFSFVRTSKNISVGTIMTILYNNLHINTLTLPVAYNYTYSFISNFITDETGEIGIDRSILAWLILNPPEEYSKIGAFINSYVYIKEETKPDVLKEHYNLHVQLGINKMYMSISKDKSSSNTVIMDKGKYIAFEKRRFFKVRINKCPSSYHAEICRMIYRNVLEMYFKYYTETKKYITEKYGLDIPITTSKIIPLKQLDPTSRQIYHYIDPVLYSHLSSKINNDNMPIPINRKEISKYKEEGYKVMKLPAIVENDPSVHFETNGEIWLRTIHQNHNFYLVIKNDGTYMPISTITNKYPKLLVNRDWTLYKSDPQATFADYPQKTQKHISRYAKRGELTEVLETFLKPISEGKNNLYRVGIGTNIINTLNNFTSKSVDNDKLSEYAYLTVQECYNQTLDEIKDDIDEGKVSLLKHYRALEEIYSINIYFIMYDEVIPFLIKPPHKPFYLHRRGNPENPCYLFLAYPNTPNKFMLIGDYTGNIMDVEFPSTAVKYFDDLMDKNNQTFIISPENNIIQKICPVYDVNMYKGWKPKEQIIDKYGKCRAIIYKKKDSYATVNIGFAPPVNLPIGKDVVNPTMSKNRTLFAEDLNISEKDEKMIIMLKEKKPIIYDWFNIEKSSRVLRTIVYILYSQSDLTYDEFIDEHIEVDENISEIYDTSNLTHSLEKMYESRDIWEYFSDIIPDMIEEDKIIVKYENIKEALRYYIRNVAKIRHPFTFFRYVVYTTDIKSGKNESIFFNEIDLIQSIILQEEKHTITEIISSPLPYIIDRNNIKYIVQMCRNIDHCKYIAYTWLKEKRNPGYNSTYELIEDIQLEKVNYDFINNDNEISYTEYNDNVYLIIKIA